MNKYKLLIALSTLIACNETTAPKNEQSQQPKEQIDPLAGKEITDNFGTKMRRIVTGKGVSFYQYTDQFTPTPVFPAPQLTPSQWCNATATNQPIRNFNFKQSLVYDDYAIIQSPPQRLNSGVVVAGRYRVYFQGFKGFYTPDGNPLHSQKIQCVRANQIYMDRERYFPTVAGQDPPADIATQTYAKGNDGYYNWGFCLGSQCATDSAWVHVQVSARWSKRCQIDLLPSTCYNLIALGQIVTGYAVWDPPYMDEGELDVKIFPTGYWTVYNYGGNALRPEGYLTGAATGYYLLESYSYSTNPNYIYWRAGQTHWVLSA